VCGLLTVRDALLLLLSTCPFAPFQSLAGPLVQSLVQLMLAYCYSNR